MKKEQNLESLKAAIEEARSKGTHSEAPALKETCQTLLCGQA
ncbi:MAG: hypothetical protein AB9903_05620 [Vulcanimicrobiota bacterium]